MTEDALAVCRSAAQAAGSSDRVQVPRWALAELVDELTRRRRVQLADPRRPDGPAAA